MSGRSGAHVVLPGDTVVSLEGHEGTVRVGVGLIATGAPSSAIVATKAGVVEHAALRRSQGGGDRYQVLNHQKKYTPAQGDSVLGVVIEKHGESYSVDIGGPHRAALSGIAFEGASRRNRPHLEVGSLVRAPANIHGCFSLYRSVTLSPCLCASLAVPLSLHLSRCASLAVPPTVSVSVSVTVSVSLSPCVSLSPAHSSDQVHAHVTRADRHVEPEISCVSTGSNTKGWMTGDSMCALASRHSVP